MLIMFCDIVEPSTGELYGRDPRSTAKRAEAYLKSTGIGDTVYVGPEAEFFMFDDVRFRTTATTAAASRSTISNCRPTPNTKYEGGNLGHRPRAKGGYFPVAPVDSCVDIRGEMVSTMLEMGLPCDKHHHEVAAGQHELGLTFGTLVQTATACRSTNMSCSRWPMPMARPRPSCRSRSRRQRLGHAHPHLDLGRAASRCSRATAMPVCPTCACTSSAASSSTPRR
jgi:hypothetical protein